MNNVVSKARARRAREKDRAERQRTRPRGKSVILLTLVGTALWMTTAGLVLTARRLPRYVVGSTARNTVICSVPFKAEDVTATRLKRIQAAESVPPVFRLDTSAATAARTVLAELLESAGTDRAEGEALSKLQEHLTAAGIEIPAARFQQLARSVDRTAFLDTFEDVLRSVLLQGIISAEARESRFHNLAARDIIILESPSGTVTSKVSRLLTPQEAAEEAARRLRSQYRKGKISLKDLAALYRPWSVPNVAYCAERTQQLRKAAQEKVKPVRVTIERGTPIVTAGDLITPDIQQRLTLHDRLLQQTRSASDRIRARLGELVVLLLFLIISSGMLLISRPQTFNSLRELAFLATVAVLALLLTAADLLLLQQVPVIRGALLAAVLPVALAPFLVTIFMGGAAALAVGVWTCAGAAMMAGRPYDVLLSGLLATIVAATSARGIHRRARLFAVGLWIGAAGAVAATALGLSYGAPLSSVIPSAALALGSGLLTAALVLILIPVFESIFRMTTDIALLELSDLGHPLLKRLAVEAPGTYHHSLMVANLAEAAAHEIGANPLLARVAAYYHDIGKLTKPEFFTENFQMRPNPHDDLAPSMSALVIASHVKEGVSLAQRHRLPPVIVEAIQQHHGTSMISFFYQRARQQQEQAGSHRNQRPVEEKDYRYPGPLPRSREMAIIALADAVEAASRTLEKPTASRIENLVREIIEKKLLDGQLDESQLTLRDLAAIRRVFTFTLTNMLHERIQYPEHETEREKPAEATSTEPGQTKGTRAGTGE
ncbi:MAG: hypothetical protein DRP22_00335 [Verrucomicrobia bacterium]|nr:MAG: hypothetical protein DRP22_00335 [Verrucomicrobiota bacterium]